MCSSRVISIVIVFAVGFFICVSTTGCSADIAKSNGITIEKNSRFKKIQNPKNSKVVYLGTSQNSFTNENFGPHDISFDIKSLR